MSFVFNDRVFFWVQAVLKYNAFDFGITLRSSFYRPFFRRLGKHVQIQDGVTVKYPSEIEIGDNVKIGQHCFLVGKGGLKIGNDTLIGAGTKIITSSHNFLDIEKTISSQGLLFNAVIIEDDVWLGFDVKIFGGSVVKRGTIVGANSIVKNKDFPEMSIIAGSPAQIIRMRTR